MRFFQSHAFYFALACGVAAAQVTLPTIAECRLKLLAADSNADGGLSLAEFYPFLASLSPFERCPDVDRFGYVLETEFVDAYDSLSCLCQDFDENPANCCQGSNKRLAVPGVYDIEHDNIVCTQLTNAVEAVCGSSAVTSPPTSSPVEFVEATESPTKSPTNAPTEAPSGALPDIVNPSRSIADDNDDDNASTAAVVIPIAALVVLCLLFAAFVTLRRRNRELEFVSSSECSLAKGQFDQQGVIVTDPTDSSEEPLEPPSVPRSPASDRFMEILSSLEKQDEEEMSPPREARTTHVRSPSLVSSTGGSSLEVFEAAMSDTSSDVVSRKELFGMSDDEFQSTKSRNASKSTTSSVTTLSSKTERRWNGVLRGLSDMFSN